MKVDVRRNAKSATVTINIGKRELSTLMRVLNIIERMMAEAPGEPDHPVGDPLERKPRADGYRVVA